MLHIPSPTRQHGLSYIHRAECTVDFLYTQGHQAQNAPKLVLARCMSCLATPLLDFHLFMPLYLPTSCVHYPGNIHLYSVYNWGVLTGLSAPRWDATWNIQMQLKQLPL